MRAVMQWIHVAGVVVAVGGTAFVRLVLLPSFVAIDGQARQRVMAGVARRFSPILWWSILAIFLSGIYNLVLSLPTPSPDYWGALTVKVVLALILFGIAFAITLPWPAFAEMQKRRPAWMLANIVLAALILLLSAYLRRL